MIVRRLREREQCWAEWNGLNGLNGRIIHLVGQQFIVACMKCQQLNAMQTTITKREDN